MNTMTTVTEVLDNLKKEGYSVDFNLKDNCLVCNGNSLEIYPEDFIVDKHYRFEGITDPADEAVVYAISSKKHGLKGTLINGYGIYSNRLVDEMVKALNVSGDSGAVTQGQTEVKFNEATPQRPEGDRLIDGPMVTSNLVYYKQQLKEEQAWKNNDRNSIALLKTDAMRIVLIALKKGAEMKTHTAPGVISVQVLEGQITFSTEQRSEQLSDGQLLSLHEGIPHNVYADKESVFLLTLAVTKD